MQIPMSPQYLLYYLPLLVAVSLVLSATRHERQDLIFAQAWRTAVWITCFMGIILLLLFIATLFM